MPGDRRRGRGALPSPRVGRKSRWATGGPRWMAIPDARFGGGGTELGLQTASLTSIADLAGHSRVGRSARSLTHLVAPRLPAPAAWTGLPGRRSVLVGAEDVRRRAGVADRRGRIEIAQGDGELAIREEAFHVVDPLGAGLDIDQPSKRAALDAVRRQLIGVGIRRDTGSGSAMSWGSVASSRGRSDGPVDSGAGD